MECERKRIGDDEAEPPASSSELGNYFRPIGTLPSQPPSHAPGPLSHFGLANFQSFPTQPPDLLRNSFDDSISQLSGNAITYGDVASEVPHFHSPETSDVCFPTVPTKWIAHTTAESTAIREEIPDTVRQNDRFTQRNMVPQLNRISGQYHDGRSLNTGSSTLRRLSGAHHQGHGFSRTENFGDVSYPSQNIRESFIQKQSVHNCPPHDQVTGYRNAGSLSGSGLKRFPSLWLNDQQTHPLGPTTGGPIIGGQEFGPGQGSTISKKSPGTSSKRRKPSMADHVGRESNGTGSPRHSGSFSLESRGSSRNTEAGALLTAYQPPAILRKTRKPSPTKLVPNVSLAPVASTSTSNSISTACPIWISAPSSLGSRLQGATSPSLIQTAFSLSFHTASRVAASLSGHLTTATQTPCQTSPLTAFQAHLSPPEASTLSRDQSAADLVQTASLPAAFFDRLSVQRSPLPHRALETASSQLFQAASVPAASFSSSPAAPTQSSSLPSTAQASCLPPQAQLSDRRSSMPTRDQSVFNLFPTPNPAACHSSPRPAQNIISSFPNSTTPATLPDELPGQQSRALGIASSHLFPTKTSPSSSAQASQAPEPAEMAPRHHIKWKVPEATAEESGYRCLLCKRDVLYAAEGPYVPPKEAPEVGVLPCGHCFHSLCLERITPDDQARDPPCIPCALGEACD